MQAFTHFSRHAFERVAERTTLSCEELAKILDRDLAIDLGRKPGFDRIHRLFYSAADDQYFVAIQDAYSGTVVTVLPLNYHAELAWEVTADACLLAKQRYLEAPPEPTPIASSNVFIVSAHFLDENGDQKTKVLIKQKSAQYNHDMKSFLIGEPRLSAIDTLAAEKGIDVKLLYGVTVRHGHRGEPVAITVRDITDKALALHYGVYNRNSRNKGYP